MKAERDNIENLAEEIGSKRSRTPLQTEIHPRKKLKSEPTGEEFGKEDQGMAATKPPVRRQGKQKRAQNRSFAALRDGYMPDPFAAPTKKKYSPLIASTPPSIDYFVQFLQFLEKLSEQCLDLAREGSQLKEPARQNLRLAIKESVAHDKYYCEAFKSIRIAAQKWRQKVRKMSDAQLKKLTPFLEDSQKRSVLLNSLWDILDALPNFCRK